MRLASALTSRVESSMRRTLAEMHTYCRPAGSATETAFIARYIATLPNAERDQFGNWHCTIGEDPILWSCHTDTVHAREGRQRIRITRDGILSLRNPRAKYAPSCLGADDTAGVFLAVEMIRRRVPGHYIFHYGEERGGIGSRALATAYPDFIRQFRCAIALDRQGTGDIITHQAGGRTASDAFATSLAGILGGTYASCDSGIYTDTAEYAHLIPECTNVSIGYARAHSPAETLDTGHVLRLLLSLSQVRIEDLTIARDPDAIDEDEELHRLIGYWPDAFDESDPLADDRDIALYLDSTQYEIRRAMRMRLQ